MLMSADYSRGLFAPKTGGTELYDLVFICLRCMLPNISNEAWWKQ